MSPIFTIPNVITLFRLVLVPVVMWMLVGEDYLITAGFIAILSFSDLLDGYLARRWHAISKVGMIMDPLADKLLIVSVVSYFTVAGDLPVWFVLSIFYRDFCVLVGFAALLLFRKRAITSSQWFGKLSTGLNLTLLFFLCLSKLQPTLAMVTDGLFIIAALSVVISFVVYSGKWFRMFRGEHT